MTNSTNGNGSSATFDPVFAPEAEPGYDHKTRTLFTESGEHTVVLSGSEEDTQNNAKKDG